LRPHLSDSRGGTPRFAVLPSQPARALPRRQLRLPWNAMSLHPKIEAVTERIRQRSAPSRAAYLAGIDEAVRNGPNRTTLSCANLAHVFAACGEHDKARLRGGATPNLGIITAYNDMLSAHQPYEHYPERIRSLARELGATAQVAG